MENEIENKIKMRTFKGKIAKINPTNQRKWLVGKN
jgi:hypothetical protein